MKKFGLFLGLYSLLFIGCASFANDYEYTNLDITANILIDGTINVKEDFTANFFVDKHGIIRTIPLNYSVGGKNFHIDVSNINVEGKKFTTSKSNGEQEIKIGDANKTVIGEQNYPISYTTYGLIRNFSGMGYAELYWNLVGYDFDTNINKIRAELILPKIYTGFTKEDFLITTDGTEKTIDGFGGTVDYNQGDRIIITYDKGLSAYQGITLAIKFPNNYFEFNDKKQKRLLGHATNFKIDFSQRPLTNIFIIIAGLFGIMYISQHWLSHKKIKPVKLGNKRTNPYPIVVQYEPPKGINSAEAGLLYNCKVDPIDISSLIYQRSTENLLVINRTNSKESSKKVNNITIRKIGDIPKNRPFYETDFFNTLFKKSDVVVINKNSKLKFASSLYGLEDYALAKKWIHRKSRLNSFTFLILIAFIAGLYALVHYFGRMGAIIRIFVTPLLYGIILKHDSKIRLKDEGEKLAAHVIGYATFIKECDENQLKFFLKEDPSFINKTLPYAIVFGMGNLFLEKITPIMKDIEQVFLTQELIDFSSINSLIGSAISLKNDSSYLTGHLFNPLSLLSGIGLFGGSYDSSDGFSSGSSFGGGGGNFSRGGGGGGGGSKSW